MVRDGSEVGGARHDETEELDRQRGFQQVFALPREVPAMRSEEDVLGLRNLLEGARNQAVRVLRVAAALRGIRCDASERTGALFAAGSPLRRRGPEEHRAARLRASAARSQTDRETPPATELFQRCAI